MDKLNQSLSVDRDHKGVRLDTFLAEQIPEMSRSTWKSMVQDGLATVNGLPCKPNHKLKAGEIVEWASPVEVSTEVLPENIPLDILHRDDALLVLNKPPGLVVHPAAGNESGTLVNALMFYDPVFRELERAGIVHRLDKNTSGVMVVARSEVAMAELQRQFKARETEKGYLALVWGDTPNQGEIETLIGRHPVHRQKMAVLSEGGRQAITSYETIERFGAVSLMRIRIETGRTHQIRVHMADLGHPIVGDPVYGRARKYSLPERPMRQMLHAARLTFNHPVSGKRLSFDAPLFDDMRRLLGGLRNE